MTATIIPLVPRPRHRPPLAPTADRDPIPDSVFAEYFLAAGITPEAMYRYGQPDLASAMAAMIRSRRPRLRVVRPADGETT
jgi:hypothetical protein